jgi:hypothetical protein
VFLSQEIEYLERFLSDEDGTIYPAAYSANIAKQINAVYIKYLQRDIREGKSDAWDSHFKKYVRGCVAVLEEYSMEQDVPLTWDWMQRMEAVLEHPWPLMTVDFMEDILTNFQDVNVGIREVGII